MKNFLTILIIFFSYSGYAGERVVYSCSNFEEVPTEHFFLSNGKKVKRDGESSISVLLGFSKGRICENCILLHGRELEPETMYLDFVRADFDSIIKRPDAGWLERDTIRENNKFVFSGGTYDEGKLVVVSEWVPHPDGAYFEVALSTPSTDWVSLAGKGISFGLQKTEFDNLNSQRDFSAKAAFKFGSENLIIAPISCKVTSIK